MKTPLQARLLFLLYQRHDSRGFTLIELLVVIIIIGILSAIALPSFLNQANKARESEAKQFIGAMNRAQQAYYVERNEFADIVPALALGISLSTNNYQYVIAGGGPGGAIATQQARPLLATAPYRAVVGGVALGQRAGEVTLLSMLCLAEGSPGQGGGNGDTVFALPAPNATLVCPTNYFALE